MKRCVALKAKIKVPIELNVIVFSRSSPLQTYILVTFGIFDFFFSFCTPPVEILGRLILKLKT